MPISNRLVLGVAVGLITSSLLMADENKSLQKLDDLLFSVKSLASLQEQQLAFEALSIAYAKAASPNAIASINYYLKSTKRAGGASVILQRTATQLIQDQHIEEAMALLQVIKSNTDQFIVAQSILMNLLAKDKDAQTQEVLDYISDPLTKSRLLKTLIEHYVSEQNMEKVKLYLEQIKDPTERDLATQFVSNKSAKLGYIDYSVELANGTSDNAIKIALFKTILESCTLYANYEKFTQLVAVLPEYEAKQYTLQRVAIDLAIQHQFDRAAAIAKSIPTPRLRANTLIMIADQALVQNQDIKTDYIIDSIKDEPAVSLALYVAKKLVAQGKFEKAIQLVEYIKEPITNFEAKMELSRLFARSNQANFTLLFIQQWNPKSVQELAVEQFIMAYAKVIPDLEKLRPHIQKITDIAIQKRLLKHLSNTPDYTESQRIQLTKLSQSPEVQLHIARYIGGKVNASQAVEANALEICDNLSANTLTPLPIRIQSLLYLASYYRHEKKSYSLELTRRAYTVIQDSKMSTLGTQYYPRIAALFEQLGDSVGQQNVVKDLTPFQRIEYKLNLESLQNSLK